jgi:hypothetical protein
MKEKVVLNPGDHYSSAITVYTPSENNIDMVYQIGLAGFYVDEDYNNIFEECVDRCEMVDWISIKTPKEGRLSPGEKTKVEFDINVPEDAHGGGQYASIIVQANPWKDGSNSNNSPDDSDVSSFVKEEKRIAYVIYAEIAGDIVKEGEVVDINVPSFLLSGNITGQSSIKNTGNVHGDASYKLQVFPLFSDEEIYTNEEKPVARTILPDRTLYHELAWENTPSIGVFNVVYTVEFEGITAQVKKMVIICPIWLLFLVVLIIAVTIISFVSHARARRAERRDAE